MVECGIGLDLHNIQHNGLTEFFFVVIVVVAFCNDKIFASAKITIILIFTAPSFFSGFFQIFPSKTVKVIVIEISRK